MKTSWRILAIAISALSILWGIWMAVHFDLLHQGDPWAMSTTAYITFGICGFPLTLIPFAIGGLMMWFGPQSWSAHDGIIHWVSTIGMVLCYFIQWHYLAWKCFSKSMVAA